jgi:O-antigen/teichoic acid export membrane protein
MRTFMQVFVLDVLSKAILGLTTVFLIREMPNAEFASYTFAYSMVILISQIIAATFNRMYILGGDGNASQDTVETFIGAQLWSCAVVVLLTLPCVLIMSHLYLSSILLLIGFLFSDFAKTYYQQKRGFFKLSMVELARAGFFLIGLFGINLLLRHELTATQAIAMQGLIMLFIALAVLTRRIRPRQLLNFRNAQRLLKTVLTGEYRYVVGYFILVAVLSSLTVCLLKILRTDYELATFGSAFRYYNMMSLCLGAVHVVMLPTIQQTKDNHELKVLFTRHRKILPLFAVGVLIAVIGAHWMIPWINGGRYPESVGVFQILAASLVISFACSPHINMLLKVGDYRYIFWLMVLGVSLTGLSSAALITVAGVLGAAWGVFGGMGAINLLVYRRAKPYTTG